MPYIVSSVLVQEMASCIISTKSLPELMLTDRQLDTLENTKVV